VAVTLVADPQRRVYVRRIDVAGNTRTRDEVVRREFRQLESSWYDGNRIKLSRDRVDRLGYFKDVNVDTSEVAGAPDQVDLTVTVTEKPTGNLLIGANYSNAEKLGLTASIKQDNVFGSGNYLGIEVNTSKTNRTWCSSASTRTSPWTASRARSTCSTAPAARSTAWATSTRSPPGAGRSASACR
jgi:outer membrane protein insertion porin family